MRHGKSINHLGRTATHRKAMMSNMAASLILHKRIHTTIAKAKALRKYVEPLLTKSKNDTMHSRRTIFSYLQNKYAVKELFEEVADKIANRPGGYTRIIKLGKRLGDNAEMCMMELVDFNTTIEEEEKASKTRRGGRRRRGGKKNKDTEQSTQAKTEEKKEQKSEEKTQEKTPQAETKEPTVEATPQKEEAPQAEASETPENNGGESKGEGENEEKKD